MSTLVNTMPPLTIQLIDDEGPSQGVIPAGAFSSDLSPAIRVVLADAGLAAGDRIQARADGVQLGEAIVLTDADLLRGYVDLATASVAPGVHSFTADVLDAGGTASQSGWARGAFVSHAIDGPGRASILGLVETVGEQGQIDATGFGTNDVTPSLRVSLFDTGARAGDQVRLTVDGQASANVVLSTDDVANGFVDVEASPLAVGVHLFAAQVVNAEGVAGAMSAKLPVRLDLTAPDIAMEEVIALNGQSLVAGSSIDSQALSFQFRIDDHRAQPGDAVGGGHDIYSGLAAGVHVELYANGVKVGGTEASSLRPDGLLQITTDALAAGDYVFTLVAMDDAGNVGFTQTPFELQVTEAPPTVSAFAVSPTWSTGWIFDA